LDLPHAAVAFGASFLAGAINSVAGGGTLISFPTLIWLGLDSVTANATSTAAIWPGTVGSGWGYRRELRTAEPRFLALIVPSLVGGLLGAWLLRNTPASTFDRLVPYLILFATLLFMAQEPIQRKLGTAGAERRKSNAWFAGVMLFQLAVGLYGGYFGAGIGILMLAALGIMGLRDIHEMNSLKVDFGDNVEQARHSLSIDVGRVVRCMLIERSLPAYFLTNSDTAIPNPMAITIRRTAVRPNLRATPAPPYPPAMAATAIRTT